MASYQDRQSFIPFRRQDIIEICLREGKLTPPEAEQFRSFAEIFTAYVHFDYQKTLENLKNNFAPIDPDADTRHFEPPSALVAGQMETSLIQDFTKTLKNANYKPLSEEDLKAAFQQDSLIPLKTDVDFNDFEDGRMLFYHRGLTRDTVVLRKFLKKKEFSFDVFERVVLLIKFKGTDHFKQKKKKQESQNFTPGKLYVYLYKKIPKYDLDILFPNVNISMTWKDLLRFGIPAISAIVPIILKALPNLILITGVILYFAPTR